MEEFINPVGLEPGNTECFDFEILTKPKEPQFDFNLFLTSLNLLSEEEKKIVIEKLQS